MSRKNVRWEEYANSQLAILHEISAVVTYGQKREILPKVKRLVKKSKKLWDEYTKPIRELAKK